MIQNTGPGYQPAWWGTNIYIFGAGFPILPTLTSTQAITIAFNAADDTIGLGAFYWQGFLNFHSWGPDSLLLIANPPIHLADGNVHQAQIDFDGAYLSVLLDNEPIYTDFSSSPPSPNARPGMPRAIAGLVSTPATAWPTKTPTS